MIYYLMAVSMGCICGSLCIFGYYGTVDEAVSLSSVIRTMAMGEAGFFPGTVSQIIYWYIPIVFFQIIFSTFIYNHFCSSSVYYFSRCENRVKWFLCETTKLYIYCISFMVSMVLSGCVFSLFYMDINIDKSSIILTVYYILIYSVYLYFTVLLINIISICINVTVAFSVTQSIIFGSIGVYTMLGTFFSEEYIIAHPIILKLNPFAHIVFSNHSSVFGSINEAINNYGIEFDLCLSMVMLSIMAVLITVYGIIIIKKYEFILLNKEVG